MAGRLTKILYGHYKKAVKDDSEHLLFLLDEENVRICHVLVVGLGYPYVGGEFFLRLQAPEEFPLKPPELRCLTENGVYMVGGKICISVGEFHASDRTGKGSAKSGSWGWRPTLGLLGFAREAMNGIICPESLNLEKHPDHGRGGLGIEDQPPEVRQTRAVHSAQFNIAHNAQLRRRFLAYAEANPHLKASQTWARQRAQAELVNGHATAETFSEAYGEELADWCTEKLPELGASGLHLRYAADLRKLDSDSYRKSFILIRTEEVLRGAQGASRAASRDAAQDAVWAGLVKSLPFLEPYKNSVLALPGEKRTRVLLHLLKHTMALDFGQRETLLKALGEQR